MSESNRRRFRMRDGEERSDEWKVVRYVRGGMMLLLSLRPATYC